MGPSALSKAIADEQWSLVVRLVKEAPEQAALWSKRAGLFDGQTGARVLPLHEALVGNAPLECIRVLVHAYPDALGKKESSYRRLPLHCACRKNADARVISVLVGMHKGACLVADTLHRLPIHYVLTNGANPELVDMLMDACPEAARSQDYEGWSPAHVAVNVGASGAVVKRLLDAYPEVVLTTTYRGNSIGRVIPQQCPHKEELRSLVTEIERAVTRLPNLSEKPELPVDRMVMV